MTTKIEQWLNPKKTVTIIKTNVTPGVVNYLATLEMIGEDPDERGATYKVSIVPAGTTPVYTGWLLTTVEGSLTQVLREAKHWV